MDSTFVWIVMFAGAAVALLGLFLIASERELKLKRREIEALLAKFENAQQNPALEQSAQPQTGQTELMELREKNRGLLDELTALTGALETSRKDVASLETSRPAEQAEMQRLRSANDRLGEEARELRSQLAAYEEQIRMSAQGQNAQQGHARLHADIDDLRLKLEESHGKIRELEDARQHLPDLNAIESEHRRERQSLTERISELELRLSTEQQKSAEQQALRERLTQADALHDSLRAEIRRYEEEIPRWQARIAGAEEHRHRLAALQAPYKELLSKQAALADRQRELHEELMAFAAMISAPADGIPNRDSVVGAKSDPPAADLSVQPPTLSAGSSEGASASATSTPTPEVRAAATGPKSRRFGILSALLLVTLAGAGAFHYFRPGIAPERATAGVAQNIDPPRPGTNPSSISSPDRQQTMEARSASPAPPSTTAGVKPVVKEDAVPAAKLDRIANAEFQTPGIYRVIRPTRVYAAPNESSRTLGDIEPGTRVDVVQARDGWLEIHSKHGRPPGFVRREVASPVAGQN